MLLPKPLPLPSPSRPGLLWLILGFLLLGAAIPVWAAEAASPPIPFSEIGAKATADYKGEAIGISATAKGATLRTGFQKLFGTITSEGLWLDSTDEGGGTLNLVATCLGREESLGHSSLVIGHSLPPSGKVSVTDKLVTFTRPGLTEEYSVSVDGVRQDFIVEERPAGTGALSVELALSGASAETASYGAKLTLESSHRALAYSRLRVVDTTGKELTATLKVVGSHRLAVHVQDAGAAYPLRIDPTFSDANWVSLNPGIPGTNSEVTAAVVDGNGNLYIGGYFTFVGTVAANYVAKWNGSVWSALGSGMTGNVNALAVRGTTLYAGGQFTTAGGVANSSNIAQWNGSVWSALGSGMNNPISALAVSGTTLYAGGNFTTAGGVTASHVAQWNGSAWSALGTGMNSTVQALAVSGTTLYAGGYFTTAGGVANTSYIAQWNGSVWSALGSGMNNPVYALAVSGTTLYAGGSFATAGGVTANSMAQWSGSAWSGLGSGINSTVYALAVSGTTLYAGGNFTTAGGVTANSMAQWNGSAWSALGSGMGGSSHPVFALAVSGTAFYAGGVFTTAGGVAVSDIAQWTGSAWLALGSGMNSAVSALAVSGTTLYAGGDFTSAGGVANTSYIAQWNGSAWSALGTGMNSTVLALAVNGTTLYAGGNFTTAGGVAANKIAQWNGSAWSGLGSGMGGSTPSVQALAVSGSTLYAGGFFTTAGGVAANYVAQWNGTAWSALGSGMDSEVNVLAVSGTTLYAGGQFFMAGGVANTSYIAQWNGSVWSALGSGMNSWVYALAVSGPTLYAGGFFTTAGGVTANRIAQWNGSTWSALGSGMTGSSVYTLAVSGATLYAGGFFTTAGGVSANKIAQWNGSTWSALGSGIDGQVNALVVSGTNLYVGGYFNLVGTTVFSPYFAEANLAPPTVTANTASVAANVSSVVITGTSFDSQAGNNSVVFNDGATGNVTAATATSLTVAFTTKPTTAGSLTAVVTTDGWSSGGAVQVATVDTPVSIATISLSNWTFDQDGYNQTITATGGAGAITFSVTAGVLPTGISLSNSGTLSGTPTVVNTFNFTVTATDTVGTTANQAYTVVINAAVPTVTTPTFASVTGTSALLGGNVASSGGETISALGVVFAPSSSDVNPQIGGSGVTNVTGTGATGVFAVNAASLTPGPAYSVAAYAANGAGTSYSAVGSFSTLDNNATLSNLTLSSGALNPTFASANETYTATVPNATTSLTVTPTTSDPNATALVNTVGVATGSASQAVPLSVGSNALNVTVTAQDGATKAAYTVAVTRLAPYLSVQQPVGTTLVNGVSSIEFGGVVPGKTTTRVFTIKNLGLGVLKSFVFSFDGVDPGDFSVTTAPAATLAIGASTTFTVTFKPAAVGARSTLMHIDATGETLNAFLIGLTGTGAAMPAITSPPTSQIVGLGHPAALAVAATGGALSYQWLKGNVAVPLATGSTYAPTVALTNAGAYTVKVSNAAGHITNSVAANLGVVNSSPATVAVVNGNTLTLTASAGGPGITYQWRKNGSILANGKNPINSLGVISGVATSRLTITKANTADADNYTCLVTMPDPQNPGTTLTLSTGVFTVIVTIKPVLDASFAPGPWIVSGTVSDVITAQNSPTAFALTGQPTGVTIDATGHFHGKPTVAVTTPTTYHLVIGTSNAAGAALLPVKVDVTVNPLPTSAVGPFNGLVDRDATLSKGYGGSLNVVSLSTGIFSGKLTLGALSYSFSAQRLDATFNGVTTPATVTIVRTVSHLPNLTLALTFHHDTIGDPANVGKVDGTVTDLSLPSSPVPLLAWRSAPPPALATIFTVAMELDPALADSTHPNEAHIVYPQGDGFGTLTVTTAGAATWSGKMSDGTVTTASVTMGPHGEVPLHFMLYTNTGSAHGWAQASGTDPIQLLDTIGTFDWVKSAQTAATLNYKNGFPLHNLTVVGAKYIKPTAANPLVLDMAPVPSGGTNAKLLFSQGGLTALTYAGTPAVSIVAAANAAQLTSNNTFRILGKATANSVNLPNPNPATFAITISATTGAFSGNFILHGDQDPAKATQSLINRTAAFSGLCVTRGGGSPPFVKGVGYFLLPELQPHPGLSVTTSPLLSGQVLLESGP